MPRGCLIAGAIFSVAAAGCAVRSELAPSARERLGGIPIAALASAPPEIASVPIEHSLEGTHPVDFYVQTAFERNPEIRAHQSRVAAEAERIPQVTSLPDPMLSDTLWPITSNSPQTAAGRMPNALTISQQFPWFGKLRLRGQVADFEARIALTELAATQLKVMEDVKHSYYDIYFFQQALAITEKNQTLIKDYIRVAEDLYKVGKTSQQDVLRAKVELSKLGDQVIDLRRQLKQSQADLAKSLATAPESDLQAAEPNLLPAPEQIDRLYQLAVASRPELQGRLQAILRDQTKIELAKSQYFPDVNVGVSWNAMMTTGGARTNGRRQRRHRVRHRGQHSDSLSQVERRRSRGPGPLGGKHPDVPGNARRHAPPGQAFYGASQCCGGGD